MEDLKDAKMKYYLGIVIFLIIVLLMLILIYLSEARGQVMAGAVIVSWDANIEVDLAGYRVYYGLAPRGYGHTVDVGNVTSRLIDGLVLERRWYFAVTAYDTAGNESGFSEEVSIYLGLKDTTVQELNLGCYNFPNPFNPEREWTNIRYYMTKPNMVSVDIYDGGEDLVAHLVREELRQEGEQVEGWDGRDRRGRLVRNGVYFAVILIGKGERKVVRMAVVR